MNLSTDSLWLIGCLPLILVIVLLAIYSAKTTDIVLCGTLLAVMALASAIELFQSEGISYYEQHVQILPTLGLIVFSAFCFVVSYIQNKKFPPEK